MTNWRPLLLWGTIVFGIVAACSLNKAWGGEIIIDGKKAILCQKNYPYETSDFKIKNGNIVFEFPHEIEDVVLEWPNGSQTLLKKYKEPYGFLNLRKHICYCQITVVQEPQFVPTHRPTHLRYFTTEDGKRYVQCNYLENIWGKIDEQ